MRTTKRLVLLLATMGAAVSLVSGMAFAASFTGTDGDDTIRATAEDDAIIGGDGDDTIHGYRGKDAMVGGSGLDRLYGGGGIDSANGGSGPDHLNGGSGKDTLAGGGGDDVLDAMDGTPGNDAVRCGPGRDVAEVDSADEADASSCEDVIVLVVATGMLEAPEVTTYQYGTHAITDEASDARYALGSDSVDLDAYVGRRVTVWGAVVPGTEDGQIEGGPPLLDVARVEER